MASSKKLLSRQGGLIDYSASDVPGPGASQGGLALMTGPVNKSAAAAATGLTSK